MRRISKAFRSSARRLRQRGSALLASLMVVVGLSLLGLAFVAISETESAISINERCGTRARAPFVLKDGRIGDVPEFSSSRGIDQVRVLLTIMLVEAEQFTSGDNG